MLRRASLLQYSARAAKTGKRAPHCSKGPRAAETGQGRSPTSIQGTSGRYRKRRARRSFPHLQKGRKPRLAEYVRGALFQNSPAERQSQRLNRQCHARCVVVEGLGAFNKEAASAGYGARFYSHHLAKSARSPDTRQNAPKSGYGACCFLHLQRPRERQQPAARKAFPILTKGARGRFM